MGWIELILLSLSLAMDCFAISCVIGMLQPKLERRYVLRFSLAFGIFQGGMPLIGWLFGESLLGPLEKIGSYIAFGILAFIGGKMLIESFKTNNDKTPEHLDITKWKNVVLLAVATSIDALAVGFSFAMIHEEHVTRAFLTIGITSFLVSFLAYTFVRRFTHPKIGKYAESIGGIVLILIGLKILLW
jgi:putative Mn2+ efflux pump MntP